MVANLQTTVPSQDMLYAVEQLMVGTITFADTAAKVIGGLPAGAVVRGVCICTQTAFNAATTNNINIGQTDPIGTVANAYVALQPIGPVGTVQPTMATTTNVQLSRPTSVTATYVPTGGGQTAGSAIVFVTFLVPR
jgi:hypothetical protein